MSITKEAIVEVLHEYEAQKETIQNTDYTGEIEQKVADFRAALEQDFASKKEQELHEVEISIQAVNRILSKATVEEDYGYELQNS